MTMMSLLHNMRQTATSRSHLHLAEVPLARAEDQHSLQHQLHEAANAWWPTSVAVVRLQMPQATGKFPVVSVGDT